MRKKIRRSGASGAAVLRLGKRKTLPEKRQCEKNADPESRTLASVCGISVPEKERDFRGGDRRRKTGYPPACSLLGEGMPGINIAQYLV